VKHMALDKISGRVRVQVSAQDPFAQWIEEDKRRHVREQVLAAATDAARGNLTPPARAFFDEHLTAFISKFDAIEEGTSDGVFVAIEAAFHIGEVAAATRFRKEVPVVHMKDNAANARKKKQEGPRTPSATEAAVRAVMNPKTKSSLASAKQIKPKVDEAAGRDVPVNTIHSCLKKINLAKKRGTL
jgi:hypothetical protein